MTLDTTAQVTTAPPGTGSSGHWIEDWRPEDEAFWKSGGSRVAARNLAFPGFGRVPGHRAQRLIPARAARDRGGRVEPFSQGLPGQPMLSG